MEFLFEKKLRSLVKEPALSRFSTLEEADLSVPVVTDYQAEALKIMVTSLYERSSFYRQKMDQAGVKPDDIKSLADLAKLPFTTKDELRGNPWALMTVDRKEVSLINVSTGTTGGEEIYIPQTWRDHFINEFPAGTKQLVNSGAGEICINALPYEMSSAGLSFHKVFMDISAATVVNVGKGGAYSPPEKTINVMRDLQPTVMITTPSYAITLAEAAAQIGFDLTSLPLTKIWLTGEGCSNSFRLRVEKIWGTKVNFFYGSLEAGVLGIECDDHAGYHIPMSQVIMEIVDPTTGEVLEPGEIGEVVATPLLRFDSPLIRYRTQDLGYIDTDPCSCGTFLPRFFMRGRLVDHLTVNEIDFSPYYIEEFLMRLPEVGNWYQFVVQPGNNDQLKIRTELAPGVEPSPELAEKLTSKMEFATGIPCEFEFVTKLPRPGSKTLRVVHE